MELIKRLFFLTFCTLFVTVESIVTYDNTISVQKITGPSGLKFKPNASKNLTSIANMGCSICFRFRLKQHEHVALLNIGQSNAKFEMEIYIERDDKTIIQVRTSNDHVEEFNWFTYDSDVTQVSLNVWHHFCFAIQKSEILMILVCDLLLINDYLLYYKPRISKQFGGNYCLNKFSPPPFPSSCTYMR